MDAATKDEVLRGDCFRLGARYQHDHIRALPGNGRERGVLARLRARPLGRGDSDGGRHAGRALAPKGLPGKPTAGVSGTGADVRRKCRQSMTGWVDGTVVAAMMRHGEYFSGSMPRSHVLEVVTELISPVCILTEHYGGTSVF